MAAAAAGIAAGGILGGLGGLFGKKKLETIYAEGGVVPAVQKGLATSQSDLTANQGNVASYVNALDAAKPTLANLRAEDLGTYGTLLGQSANYDPMANYQGVGDYLFGKFGSFSKDLAAQGDAQRKMNLAARGYGNSGASAYDSSLLANQISRNLAPAFTSVAGMVTPGAQSVAADRYANIANQGNLMSTRAGIPTRDAANELLPIEARGAVMGDYLNQVGQAGQIAKNNIMGYRETQSDINRIGSGAVQGMQSAMMGFGGSGATQEPQTTFLGGSGGGGSWSGGGGGGGGQSGSNILAMIMGLLGKGGGSTGGGTGGTWGGYGTANAMGAIASGVGNGAGFGM